MRRLLTGVALAGLVGCQSKSPPAAAPAPTTPTTAAAAPAAAAAALTAPQAPSVAPVAFTAPLPPAQRVFTADLDGDGSDEVIGADQGALWVAGADGALRFRAEGPGVVQLAAFGDYGRGSALYVARGVGRGFLDAPLVLQAIDPKTGQATEIWRTAGERNDAAYLGVADGNADGKPELVLAYYASKYMVRVRTWSADGATAEGPEVRMASSHAYGDLDGDGRVDHAIGRVYGDARGVPGDLRVELASGPVSVPTENGVKALLIAQLGDDPRPALYFVDGWVAAYGTEAKAQVKRARWTEGRVDVAPVGVSADEFTFFALDVAEIGGRATLVAQGNKRITLFQPAAGGFSAWPVGALDTPLNTAVGRAADGLRVYIPPSPVDPKAPVRAIALR